jgi:hypothetical protein
VHEEKLGKINAAHPTLHAEVKSPKIEFLKNHVAGFAGIAAAIGAIVVGALLTSGTLGLAADPGAQFNATVANVYNQYSSSFLTTATLSDNLEALLATTP